MTTEAFPRPGSFLHELISGRQKRESKTMRQLRLGNKFVTPLYRMYLLPLLGFGRILLVLTTKGRKTGKERRTPLEYHRVDGVIHLLSCRGEKADWLKNIRAYPDDVFVQVGFSRFHPRVEIIEDAAEIQSFLKWYSGNHPNCAKRFYGWDPLKDNPDTTDFSSLAQYLILARVHRWDRLIEVIEDMKECIRKW